MRYRETENSREPDASSFLNVHPLEAGRVDTSKGFDELPRTESDSETYKEGSYPSQSAVDENGASVLRVVITEFVRLAFRVCRALERSLGSRDLGTMSR